MDKKVELPRTRANFRRMVSWELSEVKERVVKKKKKRKRSQVEDEQLLEKDTTGVNNEDNEIYSSEEESFYSAPESSLSSDETTSPVVTTPPIGAVGNVILPEAVTKRGSQSKRKKKQRAKVRKVAREEFFRPICELFEDEDSVLGVSDLSLTDMGNVLSLTELCLIKIKQVVKTHNFEKVTIPYLIQMLLTQDGILRSTAAVQMRWAEKNFATLEMFYDMWEYPETSTYRTIQPQAVWPPSVSATDKKYRDTVLHCLVPELLYDDFYFYNEECTMGKLRILLHFCDFLFPLFGATGCGLDKISSQIPAVYRVNHFLKTRYPKLTKDFTEGLKLWPAYVCWARGHMRQATDFFMEAVSTLKDKCDKAICLNELGRMMSWYGDREYSGTFYRKSLNTVLVILQDHKLMQEEALKHLHPKLVQPSTYAMMASVWDMGIMDKSSARGAKLSWQAVLKEYDTISDRDVSIWYFHEAAMESQLFFHSTHTVNSTDPSAHTRVGTVSEWLNDCEEFALKYAADYPVLYYHLSLINVLAKNLVKSQKNFNNYLSNFVDHQGWSGTHIPGNPLGLLNVPNLPRIPWEALINMIPKDLVTAPVLPLYWRTKLLHPLYPYLCSKEVSYLADRCSDQINLHFTEDGYLTGDMSMDFPPMRCVLLDPFTGKVCFSQSSALAHYSGQLYHPARYPAKLAAPQPVRLLKTEWCSVEIVAGHSHDFSMTYCYNSKCPTYCFHTMLHWYGSEGSHAKLDIRKIIRKCVKDSLVNFLHTDEGPLENEIKRVEMIMDKGLVISWKYINSKIPLGRFTKSSDGRKIRNKDIVDFYLHMTHHCVIGESTILLVFQLDSQVNQPDNVLVFVPCSNVDSFMNPVVHYSVDSYDIRFPDFKEVSYYCNNHLPHIRHVYTISAILHRPPFKNLYGSMTNQNLVRHQIFDECGKVVFYKEVSGKHFHNILNSYRDDVKSYYDVIADGQLYKCSNGSATNSIVECWSLSNIDQSPDASVTLLNSGTQPCIYALPDCILVHTSAGVYTLDPIALTPMPCKMLQAGDIDSISEDDSVHDGISRPQFNVVDCTLTILSVFNVNWSPNKDKQNINNDTAMKMDSNLSYVAMAINYRLILMSITKSELVVLIDIELPGMITEFHDTGGNGYLVASSVFHNRQREDVSWLSREGRLLGVIPCLGSGPHSFCTKFLEYKSSSEDDEDLSGTYTFFNDGYGGISSIRLLLP